MLAATIVELRTTMRPRLIAILAYLAAVLAIGLVVWWFALGAALGQLTQRGQADLKLASDRLISELQSYRELAVLLAEHPVLTGLLTDKSADTQGAQATLLGISDMTGSLEIRLLDAGGKIVAQSHSVGQISAENLDKTLYFKRAMDAGLGSTHGQFGTQQQRAFTFAAPVFGDAGKPVGVVTVAVDLEQVETGWRAAPQVVFFTDEHGLVFVSNRSELLFRTRDPIDAVKARVAASRAYRLEDLRPFYAYQTVNRSGFEIWTQDQSSYLPNRALSVTQSLPLMNMTGEVLVDSSEAEQLALFQALVAAGIGLIFGAVVLVFAERRRGFLDRLALEAEANARLEARVAERTVALQRAQQDLVQAGKLSALGQMSAGISHELNQPLMAIRSYAENAEEFLRRGKGEVAGENLTRISDLARRMGRIIKNLRAFARQETEPFGRVELGAVMDAVLDLTQTRLREDRVTLTRADMPVPVFVLGGEVRLQQVLMNLISNAIDAMEGRDDKQLELSVDVADAIHVSVRDNGPGLSDPEKIFEPFYTTKEVGRSEGMGLGLSISYGIVQSFGGAIRGRNHPEGGAEFTIELSPAPAMEAAA